MTDPFGVVAGAIGIAAAFTACVDCVGYVQFGRHFGQDFQTDLLTLNCARLRLTRWGQAVNIYMLRELPPRVLQRGVPRVFSYPARLFQPLQAGQASESSQSLLE